MWRVWACLWLLGNLAWAEGLREPEYEIHFRDASHLRKAFRDNAWANEFAQSNLYRGTMVKLGSVLFAVGSHDDDSWKGRLVDYFYDKVLEGKRTSLSYFRAPGLVSPFGISVFDLSSAERQVLNLFIAKQRLGESVNLDGTSVIPVGVRLQKFAVVLNDKCLAVSRDPKVAAKLGRSCRAPKGKHDALVDVDLKEFFPAWYPVLDKLVGVGRRAELAFDYDKSGARFVPARASVPLQKGHLLGSGSMPPELLGAVPADTLFFATAFLPDVGRLNTASVEGYFRAARGQSAKAAAPFTFLYLGMQAWLNGRQEALSAVLIPQKDVNDALLEEINTLFNETGKYEVKFTGACPGFVALSPSKAALDRIQAACGKKAPSFGQMSRELVAAFSGEPISSGLYFNSGLFLKSTLAHGWEINAPQPEAEGTRAPTPREIAGAMDLVGKLPSYAFSGKATNDRLAMTGVKP